VVCPANAGLAVLTGSVLFGLEPLNISSRIARFTFGTTVIEKFVEGYHDPKNKIIRGTPGKEMCEDIFSPLVKVGDRLESSSTLVQTFQPVTPFQRFIGFDIYKTPKADVRYTDDPSCIYVGTVHVTLDISCEMQRPFEEREVCVRLYFGRTQLTVAAESRTGAGAKAQAD
jgi:hypothetical protein